MTGNLDIYEKGRSVPGEAKRRINGGRMNGKTDINPMWRIKKLTELFGPCGIGWYYKPVHKWIETVGSETAAFVDIELFVKHEGEWSMPISGTGGNMLAEKEKSGVHVSDECYKMATTDAISVACKQLGIGADVYWDADATKYGHQDDGRGRAGDGPPAAGQTAAKPPVARASGAGPVAGGTADPPAALITSQQIDTLFIEMKRTGVSEKALLDAARVDDLHKLTIPLYEGLMKRLRATPDKPQESYPGTVPPDDMDDEGLPWNTPRR